jgi:hypothetical protein
VRSRRLPATAPDESGHHQGWMLKPWGAGQPWHSRTRSRAETTSGRAPALCTHRRVCHLRLRFDAAVRCRAGGVPRACSTEHAPRCPAPMPSRRAATRARARRCWRAARRCRLARVIRRSCASRAAQKHIARCQGAHFAAASACCRARGLAAQLVRRRRAGCAGAGCADRGDCDGPAHRFVARRRGHLARAPRRVPAPPGAAQRGPRG